MKQNWKRSAVTALLIAALAAGALMASCSGDTEKETTGETTASTTAPSTDADKESTPAETTAETAGTTDPDADKTDTEPSTSAPVAPVEKDEPTVLVFEDDWTTTEKIEEKREITVPRSSDRVVITGEGNFTVTYTAADGEKTLTAENGSLTMENTATPHMGMVLTISVEKSMTLTFTLDFDKGAEENPYDVAEGDTTTVSFTKDAYIRIAKAGWYRLEGEKVELTNYSLENDGRVFLAVGVYGMSTTASGEVSVTITHLETPVGYDESEPADIPELGVETSLDLYNGVELYFAYTAKEAGFYEIALGDSGKSINGRFALNSDSYETYYGRYYTEDGEWLTCAGGKSATVFLMAGQRVIVKADYALSANMAGGDTLGVVVKASEGAVNDIADGEGTGTLTKGGRLVFRFTAPAAGAYEANMGMGKLNQSCRFTSSLDDGVYYGNEGTADSKLMQLEAGQVVYFIVDCPSGSEGNVSFMIGTASEQPWPAGIKTGVYVGKSIELSVDRDSRQLSLNGSAKVRAYYAEGKITFSIGVEGAEAQAYTLTLAENGADLELSWVKTSSETGEQTVTRTLTYQEDVEPIAIDLWEGVYNYTDKDGKTTKLTIYSDGSGLLGTSRYDITDNGCEYTDRNVLQWEIAYTLTVAEQDKTGKVTKVSVTVHGEEEPILFTLTDEAVVRLPGVLPIEVDDKFTGANGYQLYYQGSYQYFNDRVFTIIGYDEASKTYTIAGYDTASGDDKAEATYRLTIVDAETVKVYDAEGKELLDTLKKEKPISVPDMKANGTKETSLAVDDTGRIYLKVTKTGWYTFTTTDTLAEVFTVCTVPASGKPSADVDSKQTVSTTSGLLLKLTEGTVIGIYGDVSALYSATEPEAKLGSEKKPYAMEGQVLEVTGLIDGKNVYYVSYTASEAGTYDIGFNIDKMHFVVNNKDYGRSFEGLSWVNYDSVCTVKLAAGETVVIALNRPTTTGDDAFIGVAPTGTLQDVLDAATSGNKPIPVTSFTIEQQGKYEYSISGWDSVSYALTLNANGKVDLVRDGESMGKNLSVTLTGDTYSFTYDYYGNDLTASFTFQNGGIAFKENEYSDEVLLTIGGGSSATESLFDTAEQGSWADENWDHILLVYEDSVVYAVGDNEYVATADDLDKTLDGLSWTFTCEAGTVSFRLTEVDGTPAMILLVDGAAFQLFSTAR